MQDAPTQLRFSWLDFKVGFRMLARYPGLTLVGTVAIAVAIALGTLYFEAVNKWQNPRLPIRDADRVVSIRNWDVNAFAAGRAIAARLRDLARAGQDGRPPGRGDRLRAQPRHRGRARGAGAGSGDHGQRVPADGDAAAAGSHADGAG